MIHNPLTITVGGSYCEQTKAAAYSFSIREGETKIYHTGYFITQIHSVHDAVLCGIGNALFYLFNCTDIVVSGKLHINIDSGICHKAVMYNEIRSKNAAYLKKISDFKERNDRALKYVRRVLGNHVPGFTVTCLDSRKKVTAGEWCLHYCNKYANKAMKNQRNTIKNGTTVYRFEENL